MIQALKSWAVVDSLKIIVLMSWEGMSPSLEKSEMDSRCTSRLTQGRYQESMTTCCTGENSPPPSPSPGLEMSGWLGWKGLLPSWRQVWESSPTSHPPLVGSSTMRTLRSGWVTQPSAAASMSTHRPAVSLSPSVVQLRGGVKNPSRGKFLNGKGGIPPHNGPGCGRINLSKWTKNATFYLWPLFSLKLDLFLINVPTIFCVAIFCFFEGVTLLSNVWV